jgi:23S rRNA pseudouridine2604 synthase
MNNDKQDISIRINTRVRDLGLASRREADDLIKEGKIHVNGKIAKMGQLVSLKDKISIVGKTKKLVYYAFYKPTGIVTTNPQGDEKDIISTVKFPHKVYPLGRIDKDSHGLVILSNDGRITSKMLDSKHEHEKEYEVIVNKNINNTFIQKMSAGLTIELKEKKYKTKPCKVKKLDMKKFSIILTEGKNRQIRRMCEALGYKVMDLKRIRVGKVLLGNLKPNNWREIKTQFTKK